MRVARLQLQNYRQYAALDLTVPEGVVGIVGPNGSGKSTLLEAIRFCLFGPDACRTTKDGILRTGASGPCWAAVAFESPEHGTLVFRRELDGEAEVTANGKLVAKSARGATQYAVTLFGDLRAFTLAYDCRQKELDIFSRLRPAERREYLLRWLGIQRLDKVVDAVRAAGRETKAMWDGMAAALSDPVVLAEAIAQAEVALVTVTEARATAMKEAAVCEDEVYTLREKTDALLARDREAEGLRRQIAVTTEAREQQDARLTAAQREIVVLDEALRRLAPLRTALAALAGAQARAAELIRQREGRVVLERERTTLRTQASHDTSELQETDPVVRAFMELDLPALEADAARASAALETDAARLGDAKAAQMAAASALTQARDHFRAVLELGPEAPCPVCARPIGADHHTQLLTWLETEGKALATRASTLEADVLRIRADLDGVRRHHDEAARHLRDAVLAKARSQEAEKRAASARARLARTQTRLAQIETMFAEAVAVDETAIRTAEDQAAKETALASEVARLEGRLEALGGLQTDVAALEDALRTTTTTIARLDAVLAALAPDPDDLVAHEALVDAERRAKEVGLLVERRTVEFASLTERLQDTRARADAAAAKRAEAEAIRTRSQMLAVLAEALAAFRSRLAGRIQPALSRLASDLFGALVEGRYEGIVLTDEYEVLIAEHGAQYPLARFSGGEEDLAALAIRLAVARLVSGTGASPRFLLLDEPFTSLDAGHLANALAALRHLRQVFPQIIVVSHMGALKDAATALYEVRELADGTSAVVPDP